MRTLSAFAIAALLSLIALGAVENGSWALRPSEQPGKVQFSMEGSHGDGHYNMSSTWNVADFKGLAWQAAPKHDVHFSVARDAGTIDAEGFMQDQRGAGLFTFHPNSQYGHEMSALGFSTDGDELFAFAIHDVSLDFARAMKTAHLRGLDAHKLLAFRIHGVTPEFISDLRSAGIEAADSDRLVAFRIHGVSPEFVRNLHSSGIQITDEEKLVAFRIHGVSPEFVTQLNHLGYAHPPADQLIALRMHGVTPEYIENLRTHGLRNLTLDQLVNLRIHGID